MESVPDATAKSFATDVLWHSVCRSVAEGDFGAYAKWYAEDAVYVSAISGESHPISQALAGWKQGFIDTREGRIRPRLEFRFSQRLQDVSTAHETGIFLYSSRNESGEEAVQLVHFEALLVKQGPWRIVMEYQKSPASYEEWEALA